MENYFVILSEGAYSDYSPRYFIGNRKITKEELYKKGEEIGDILELWKENLPFATKIGYEQYKYDIKEDRIVFNCDDKWFSEMVKWLDGEGFKDLPDDIPEINIYYDMPTSKNKVEDRE